MKELPRIHFGVISDEDPLDYKLTPEEQAALEEDSINDDLPASEYVKKILGFDPEELFSEEEEKREEKILYQSEEKGIPYHGKPPLDR